MNYFKFFSRLSDRNIYNRPNQREVYETQKKSQHFSEVALDKLKFSALVDLSEDSSETHSYMRELVLKNTVIGGVSSETHSDRGR